ncbi:MAG: ATP-grasp domain-containing protein [Deltaproteobacteria bacterium]|nr:ATP-grasp domain-containing protein [Deltaproteobacteria bacterium]
MCAKQKHLLFLGSDNCNDAVEVHRRAKQLGYLVTLASLRPSYHSAEVLTYVDNLWDVNVNSATEVLSKIKELSPSNCIDGVVTLLDYWVVQAAQICNKLGLPNIKPEVAELVRNKYLFRLELQRTIPELNPKFCIAYTVEEAIAFAKHNGYPVVAKQQDGFDSRNIQLLRNRTDLGRFFDYAQSWKINAVGQPIAKGVLLESYIVGTEYSIETYQCLGGKLRVLGASKKLIYGKNRGAFIKIGAAFPWVSEEADIAIKATVTALETLGLSYGIMHTELKMTADGPKLLEINPRMPGDNLGVNVIGAAVTVSPAELVPKLAVGESVDCSVIPNIAFAIHRIPAHKNGVLSAIDISSVIQCDGVEQVKMFPLDLPVKVKQPNCGGDLLGYVIARGDTASVALTRVTNAAKRLMLVINYWWGVYLSFSSPLFLTNIWCLNNE